MRVLPLKVVLVALFLSMSPAFANSDQQVDPKIDVIVGPADAAHEMIIYYAPGCPHCLSVHKHVFDEVRAGYVVPGKLRVVLRAVPVIFPQRGNGYDDERYVRAQKLSISLGFNLRCRHHYHGANALLHALETQIAAIDALPKGTWRTWPYLPEADEQEFIQAMLSKGGIVREEFDSCVAPPLHADFKSIFKRNTDLLREVTGQLSVPAYFLNERRIVAKDHRSPPDVMRALLVTIGAPSQ